MFEKAKATHERLLDRLVSVGEHLGKNEHLATIGTLEGFEADINRIRQLMLLLRDCLEAPEQANRGGES